ncbi:hypothetical protein V8G54_026699 [Vigna mungo]|uniref:U-box domain-containing protein n=1 Tax=Vigna mungo TaxID=3915 RepID=A0AAQ3MZ82_VIGMU
MFFDDYTYNFVLGAYARSPSASTLWVGRQLHSLIVKHGVGSNMLVSTTKIYFYSINKDIISARQVFDEMSIRSSVTWNAMITCYSSLKEGNRQYAFNALSLFMYMVDVCGINSTDTTIVAVLSTISQMGLLETGACVHAFAEKTFCTEDDVFIGTGLVDMYSKCGCLDSALSVFWRMNQKNILTWTAMTIGLAIHGKGKQALEVLYKMGDYGVKPNEATFTSFLFACCHGGLVEEGLQLFHEMKRTFNVTPQIKHYGCIVDLLGRAGKLKEAYEFIMQMSINPDDVIWRILLGACKIHEDVVMGEKVGKFLLQLEECSRPELTSKSEDYVSLSNVYALAERWVEVESVRKQMRAKRISNNAGCSAVQIRLTVERDNSTFPSCKSNLFVQVFSKMPLQNGSDFTTGFKGCIEADCGELFPWGRNRIKGVKGGAVSILIELFVCASERRTCELILIALGQLCGCAEGRADLLNHGAGVFVVSKKIIRVSLVASDRGVRILASICRYSANARVLHEMLQVGAVSKFFLVLQVNCGFKTKERAKEISQIALFSLEEFFMYSCNFVIFLSEI